MKKVFAGIAVILVVIVAFSGYKYWNSTYNGQEAYAVVPTGVKEKSKTASGGNYKVNGRQYYHYTYQFTWVTASGKAEQVSFEGPESADPTPLTPGSYVFAKVSSRRVIAGPNPISADKIPAAAKAKLK